MSDDIVTRLREYEAITDNAYVINALVAAADEIERLRQLADSLAHHLQGYVCHCNMSKCKCGYDDVLDEWENIRVRSAKYDALMSTTDWEDEDG